MSGAVKRTSPPGKRRRTFWRSRSGRIVMAALIALGLFVFVWGCMALFFRVTAKKTAVSTGYAALPTVSFLWNDTPVNRSVVYANDIHMAFARESILPISGAGKVQAVISFPGEPEEKPQASWYVADTSGKEQTDEMPCEVTEYGGQSSNGSEFLMEFSVAEAMNAVKSPNPTGVGKVPAAEATLIIRISLGDKTVFAQTRLTRASQEEAQKRLNFVKGIQEKIWDTGHPESLSEYFEPDGEAAVNDLSHVTLHSSLQQISWNGLNTEKPSDVQWVVTDSNDVYTGLVAVYNMQTSRGDRTYRFRVREYFRVRSAQESAYLLDYDRRAQFCAGETGPLYTAQRVSLDVGDSDQNRNWIADPEGNYAAVVQADGVWQYSIRDQRFVRVYERPAYACGTENTIRLLGQNKDGTLVFSESGYESRGQKAGENGIRILVYDAESGVCEQKACVPFGFSAGVLQRMADVDIWYSISMEKVYARMGGYLYEVDLQRGDKKEGKPTVKLLSESLSKKTDQGYDLYTVDAAGGKLAYIADDGTLHVLTVEDGTEWVTKSSGTGQRVYPVGFIGEHLAVANVSDADKGKDFSQNNVEPAYEIGLYDENGALLQSYKPDGKWIVQAKTEQEMLHVRLAGRDGDVYTISGDDYITSNRTRKDAAVRIEHIKDEHLGKMSVLMVDSAAASEAGKAGTGSSPQKADSALPFVQASYEAVGTSIILQEEAKQFSETVTAEKYGLFYTGELKELTFSAADAVRNADANGGVVTGADGSLFWERGNRDLSYMIDANIWKMWGSDPKKIDGAGHLYEELSGDHSRHEVELPGCTLSEAMYFINHELPVFMTLPGGEKILIVGYTQMDVTYIDAKKSDPETKTVESAQEMWKGGVLSVFERNSEEP